MIRRVKIDRFGTLQQLGTPEMLRPGKMTHLFKESVISKAVVQLREKGYDFCLNYQIIYLFNYLGLLMVSNGINRFTV